MKRITSLLTCFVMLLSFIPQAFSEEVTEEKFSGFGYEHNIIKSKPMVLLDFENFHLGASAESGLSSTYGSPYPKEGRDGGKCLAFGGEARAKIDMPTPLTQGKYLISFDFNRSKIEQTFYMYMNLEDSRGEEYYDTFALTGSNLGRQKSWSAT